MVIVYFSINCWFEDDYIESLSDDDVIIGYTISAGDSGFSFNGITLGMTETDFLAMMGTPARVFNQSDMGNEYFYLDEDGNKVRGKLTHTYIDDCMSAIVTDWQGVKCAVFERSSIHLEPCDFKLNIASQYLDFLKGYSEIYD